MLHSGQPGKAPSVKRGYQAVQRHHNDNRTVDRLVAHYELEVQLADRLKHSSAEERRELYTSVYTELFDSLHDHPQHVKKHPSVRTDQVSRQLPLIRPWIIREGVYLEIGCGDAALTKAVAPLVTEAIGVDVTGDLIDFATSPANFRFVQTDGTTLALPDASVDAVYSNQLMEHLHPDDAIEQLREIVRVLRPGRKYVCVTPSRVTGPHDISRYFEDTPRGFHLREYDYSSLRTVFMDAGFRSVAFPVVFRGKARGPAPYFIMRATELVLLSLPRSLRLWRYFVPLAGITAIATH